MGRRQRPGSLPPCLCPLAHDSFTCASHSSLFNPSSFHVLPSISHPCCEYLSLRKHKFSPSHKEPVTHWPFACLPLEGESQDRLLRQTWSQLGRTPTVLGTQNMMLRPAQLPRVDLRCLRWSGLVTSTQTIA